MSVKYIIDLFDTLVKPVLTYGSAVYGIQNCMVVETFDLKFPKKILKVKTSTKTCMIYAETGRYPLSIDIKLNMIKQWLKIIRSDDNKLIRLVYCSMKDCSVRVSKRNNWVLNIKELLYSTGFGYVWEQQTVNNEYQFIREFKRRMQDMYVQQCFGEIRDSSRCRLYREIKFTFEMEPYLQNNCNRELRQCLTKIRLSSHKFLVERSRWAKPQIIYQEKKCTLCGQLDVEDEYHVLLICSQYSGLRAKFIRKQFYVKPSMLKFQKLLTTTNSKDLQRLMTFIKLIGTIIVALPNTDLYEQHYNVTNLQTFFYGIFHF